MSKRFRPRRQIVVPFLVLLFIALTALFAPQLSPYDPLDAENGAELKPSSSQHLLGTDWAGRDVLTRVLYGGRVTIFIAVISLLFAIVPGVGLGLIAGYNGGWSDAVISALVDALLSIPSLVLALALLTILDGNSTTIAFTVGIAGIPAFVRVTRSAVVTVKNSPYVEAARALGASDYRIVIRHILPNIIGPLFAYVAVMLSWAILNAATLHFLGFGGDPSTPEWGSMLAESRTTFRVALMPALAPGLAIMLTLLCINLLADALS
jgi:peptide/nickel transport system permease protein